MAPWQKYALILASGLLLSAPGCITKTFLIMRPLDDLKLNFDTPVDSILQEQLATVDATAREHYGIESTETAVGVLDLRSGRLALINPDQMQYAASIAKIGILLAWFQNRKDSGDDGKPLSNETRRELGLMIKASSNEMAAKFSEQLGLVNIQGILNAQRFYDIHHGGGLWVGKHYGKGGERIGDPLGDNSHGATVRQVLRFYLLLAQHKLVSSAASQQMLDIFASPEIPHDDIKFVKALRGRDLQILRKWGSWETWLHDSAIIKGEGRHYILVGLTHHPKGDEYLEEVAKKVDDLFIRDAPAN